MREADGSAITLHWEKKFHFERRQISNDLEGVLYVSELLANLPTESAIQFVFRHH